MTIDYKLLLLKRQSIYYQWYDVIAGVQVKDRTRTRRSREGARWPTRPVGALRVRRNRRRSRGGERRRALIRRRRGPAFPPAAAVRPPVQYKRDNWPWSICAKRMFVRPVHHVTCALGRRSKRAPVITRDMQLLPAQHYKHLLASLAEQRVEQVRTYILFFDFFKPNQRVTNTRRFLNDTRGKLFIHNRSTIRKYGIYF